MKKVQSILMSLVVFVIIASCSIPAIAATPSPYGYTYDDAAAAKTVYKYYSYNTQKKSYELKRECYSKGTYIFLSNGTSTRAAGAGSRYAGYDVNGNFYIITPQNYLLKIDLSYNPVTLKITNCTKINYTADDIAVSVNTKQGTFLLSTLKPTLTVPDIEDIEVPAVLKSKNRVEICSNSAGEQVVEAYQNNKKKLQLIVSKNERSVLNATSKVRLSDTLKGAKFVGIDASYNVYLCEGSSLYRFKFGSWYSAQKMALSGSYKSYKKDANGFISKIVTSKDSYSVKQLTTSSKWKASKTYAVAKSGYATLYVKGSTTSHTLSLKSGILYLDGKKVAKNVKKFVFVNSKKFAYIKTNGSAYTATLSAPSKAKKIATGAKSFKTTSGLGTKVVTKKGTKKL